jgi:two-component system, OmpR family, sensor histidine kinase BaeS
VKALGLRLRMFGATALVLLGVLVAVGLFTRVTVRREFDHFLVRQDDAATEAALARLEAYFREHGSWREVDPLLARILAEQQRRTLIVGARGEVLARHPDELREWTVAPLPAGGLELSRRSAGSVQQLALRGPLARVRGADGRDAGDVYLLPVRASEPPGNRAFAGSVDRWLLSGLAAALAASLALTASLVRRVLAPVQALTAGARSLAAGRLDVRVPALRRDELGELARSFNAMAEVLERNEEVRRDLVSDVAHELRTPLAGARAAIEAAQDGLVPADAAFLASLQEDVCALARLVDDLQQLSLAQAGALRLETRDVTLAEAVGRVVDAARPEAVRRGLALRLDVPAGLRARADADRVQQIVRNLVTNALVHARTEIALAAAEDGGRVALRVADDGEGVPSEAAARVFDRFFRADASRSRATGGTGLGLAIARQLAGLIGGTLLLENRPGTGATFVLTLPRA